MTACIGIKQESEQISRKSVVAYCLDAEVSERAIDSKRKK